MKNKTKIIAGVVILAVLAAAFWYGGGAPGLHGWKVGEELHTAAEPVESGETETKAETDLSAEVGKNEETPEAAKEPAEESEPAAGSDPAGDGEIKDPFDLG